MRGEKGSPQTTFETDEVRTYFLIDIPCHPKFISDKVVVNADVTKYFIKDIKDVVSYVGKK